MTNVQKVLMRFENQFQDKLQSGCSMMAILVRDVILKDYKGENRNEYFEESLNELIELGYFKISQNNKIVLTQQGFDYIKSR